MPDLGEVIELIKSQYASYGYLIVLIAAYMENTVLLGIVLPGSSMLILGAAFAAQGTLSLPLVILLGWLGMFLGCCTDYWIGRAGLWRLIEKTRLGRWLNPGLKEAQLILERWGGRSIFLAHGMGQVRTFVAVTAGIVKFPFKRFAFYELGTTFFWCLIYCGAGYFVGDNLNSVQDFFKVLAVVSCSIVALALYFYWKHKRKQQLEVLLKEKEEEKTTPKDYTFRN